MGADMLVASVDFPKEHDLKVEEEKLITFVKDASKDIIEMVYNEIFYGLEDDLDDPRVEVEGVIKRGFEALKSRQSTWITVQDRIVYLSGGLSWGDAPTDKFEEINALSYIKGLSER